MRTIYLILISLLLVGCAAASQASIYRYQVPDSYQNDYVHSPGYLEFTNPRCVNLAPGEVSKVQYGEEQINRTGGVKITYVSTPAHVYIVPFLLPNTATSGVFITGRAIYKSEDELAFSGDYLVPVTACPSE